MRNLILVTLILQLVLILTEAKDPVFGDLISFERKCPCLSFITYKHWAVYVGDMFKDEHPGKNILQRTGPQGAVTDCGFGVLENERGITDIENYLDEYFKGELLKNREPGEIKKRITHWMDKKDCGTYSLLTNNCEHLATHMRYGYKILQQPGTTAGKACNILSKVIECDEYNKLLKKMEENEKRREECETKCPSSAPNAG